MIFSLVTCPLRFATRQSSWPALPASTGMTIRQLCDAAIRYSDGTAGNLLMRENLRRSHPTASEEELDRLLAGGRLCDVEAIDLELFRDRVEERRAVVDRRGREPLGSLVSNAALRRALFECVQAQDNCDLIAESTAHTIL